MNKILLLSILMILPLGCYAEPSKCALSEDTVKQTASQNADNVAVTFWESGRDKRSGEQLKTLHIVYKNGDHAVIQHKYCSMYNFEVTYFRSRQNDDFDEIAVGKITASLYEQYSAKKPKFTQALGEIISSSLKNGGFDKKNDVRIGLPEESASYEDARVEYSIRYKSLYRSSSIYSSVTTLYIGIGGEG